MNDGAIAVVLPELPAATIESDFTVDQIGDIGALLARHLTPGNIEELAKRALGTDLKKEELYTAGQAVASYAHAIVLRLQAAGCLPAATAILKSEAARNGALLAGLNHVLSGFLLSTLQATAHSPQEPYLDNDFLQVFPQIQRTVCAIGLGSAGSINKLVGTGFLIGPDLVMTNFHVVSAYLNKVESAEGKPSYEQAVTGDNIYCFFDYLSAPPPFVPAQADQRHSSIVVQAAEKWLVRTREPLTREGKAPYPTEGEATARYDYAIIKLSREIGKVPSTRSGGAPRGWLDVATQQDYLAEKRVVVLQHPAGAHQLFDIGNYRKLDPSKTRVWYSVNTDYGSSGGAAVDTQGKLYALHNARVYDADNRPTDMNQGVRIDKIFEDLQVPPACELHSLEQIDTGLWSLGTADRPQPIIGRESFRQYVTTLMKPAAERCIAVVGKRRTGRRFSVQLLRRLVGPNTPVVHFRPSDLETLSPANFLEVLKQELQFPFEVGNVPPPSATEPLARWLTAALPNWLGNALALSKQKDPTRYPCWIVIDTVTEEPGETEEKDKRLIWADGLRDLISAMSGGHDEGQQVADLTDLRWLMLGSDVTRFPQTRWRRLVDDLDLAKMDDLGVEFAQCLLLAWRSIEVLPKEPANLLSKMGPDAYELLERHLPPGQRRPPLRAFLAEYVGVIVGGRTGP